MKEKVKKGNWGYNPVKKVDLTKGQAKELQNRVVKAGKSRLKSQGKIDECDFLAGAMATMHHLGIDCPLWVFQVMAGVKIITKEDKK